MKTLAQITTELRAAGFVRFTVKTNVYGNAALYLGTKKIGIGWAPRTLASFLLKRWDAGDVIIVDELDGKTSQSAFKAGSIEFFRALLPIIGNSKTILFFRSV